MTLGFVINLYSNEIQLSFGLCVDICIDFAQSRAPATRIVYIYSFQFQVSEQGQKHSRILTLILKGSWRYSYTLIPK